MASHSDVPKSNTTHQWDAAARPITPIGRRIPYKAAALPNRAIEHRERLVVAGAGIRKLLGHHRSVEVQCSRSYNVQPCDGGR